MKTEPGVLNSFQKKEKYLSETRKSKGLMTSGFDLKKRKNILIKKYIFLKKIKMRGYS
jgi:hypothetical protein